MGIKRIVKYYLPAIIISILIIATSAYYGLFYEGYSSLPCNNNYICALSYVTVIFNGYTETYLPGSVNVYVNVLLTIFAIFLLFFVAKQLHTEQSANWLLLAIIISQYISVPIYSFLILPLISNMTFIGGLSLFYLLSLLSIAILIQLYIRRCIKYIPRIFTSRYLFPFLVITIILAYMLMTYVQIYQNVHSIIAAFEAILDSFFFLVFFFLLLIIIKHDIKKVSKHNNELVLIDARNSLILFEISAMTLGYIFYAYFLPVIPKGTEIFLDPAHIFGAFIFIIFLIFTLNKITFESTKKETNKEYKENTLYNSKLNHTKNNKKNQNILSWVISVIKKLSLAEDIIELFEALGSRIKRISNYGPSYNPQNSNTTQISNSPIFIRKSRFEKEEKEMAKSLIKTPDSVSEAINNRSVGIARHVIKETPEIANTYINDRPLIYVALERCIEDIIMVQNISVQQEHNQVIRQTIRKLAASKEILKIIYTAINENKLIIDNITIEYAQEKINDLKIQTTIENHDPIYNIIFYSENEIKSVKQQIIIKTKEQNLEYLSSAYETKLENKVLKGNHISQKTKQKKKLYV